MSGHLAMHEGATWATIEAHGFVRDAHIFRTSRVLCVHSLVPLKSGGVEAARFSYPVGLEARHIRDDFSLVYVRLRRYRHFIRVETISVVALSDAVNQFLIDAIDPGCLWLRVRAALDCSFDYWLSLDNSLERGEISFHATRRSRRQGR